MNSEKTQNNDFALVADALRNAKRVFAVTHVNPDGDALGSLCFFNLLLKKLRIDCQIFCVGPLPSSLEFLSGYKDIKTNLNDLDLNNIDCFVSLDCATPQRTNVDHLFNQRSKGQLFIEIDHHQIIPSLADIILRIPESASTTQILAQLAETMNIELDRNMAQCLLTGIVTDTANFSHPNSTTKTMEAAAALIGQGANLSRINNLTTRTKKIVDLKLWGIALSRLTRHPRFNLVWTVLTPEDLEESGADNESLEGIAGFLNGLEADAVMVLYGFKDGTVRGSLRSSEPKINVAALASALGGGGHRQAAGFTLQGRFIHENGNWKLVI